MPQSNNGQLTADAFAQKLASAQDGCTESLGNLLEPCRQYLLLIANQELNPTLTAKVGASDLVQETFLAAGRNFQQFRGWTDAELRRWLRQILENYLLKMQRQYIEAQKRCARREVSLNGSFDSGADTLPGNTESPSNHVMHSELTERIEAAFERLPVHYHQLFNLRYRQGLAFNEVARQLALSPDATRQLWMRAIRQLKTELSD